VEGLLHELSVHQVELEAQNENLKAAQMHAEEAQQHYSLLFHDAPVAYFVLDDDGVIKEVNREGERLIGLPASRLLNTHLRTYLSRDSFLTFRRHLNESLTANEKRRCNVVLRKWPTEEPANVLVESVSLSSPSGSHRVRTAFIDITELRRAEEQIRLLKHSIDFHYDAAFWMDTDNRFVYVNEAACTSLGYTREELMGMTVSDISPGRTAEAMEEFWQRLRDEGPLVYETAHRRKDGTEFPVELVVTHIRSQGYEYACGFARDISEKKRLEAQLRQAQKMEALGTLTGGIAHDFNNILAAVIGFTELAKDRAFKGSIQQAHLDKALKAGMRGRELVKRLLAFSKRSEPAREPLHLASIVEESMKLLRASIPSTIKVRVKAKSDSSLVLADPTQIQQVLMNLCTNAAHAMREKGGDLEVTVAEVSPSLDLTAHGMKEGPCVALTVRDTGVGMTPEIVERIFDPFFTTKDHTEGTGLGLSVVHGIVEQHEGCITVESEPGKGSAFTVYLPKVGESTVNKADTKEVVPTGHERVLFIDDEEPLTDAGRSMLQRLGYEVTVKNDPAEALELFRADPAGFDLVITDQTMPGLTGMDLFAEMRAIRRDLPVILVTGYSDLVDAEKAKTAGIRAFVMKPLTKGEIARTIRQVLDG